MAVRIITKILNILKSLIIIKKFDDGTFSYYIRFPLKLKSAFLLKWTTRNKKVIPNKIVFDNYMGRGYGCNAKYVAEKIHEKYPNKYDMVWLLSADSIEGSSIPDWIRVVDYNSEEALMEYATAKFWVSNYHKISFLNRGLYKKKEQCFIQMWHGSLGIKKIENDVSVLKSDNKWLKQARKSSSMVDYWISNSSFEDTIYKQAFWNVTDDKILKYGHPRNDVFFCNNDGIKKKVMDYYHIEDKNIVLYAPTFREDGNLEAYNLDYELLVRSLSDKFGGQWVVLARLHPRLKEYSRKMLGARKLVYDVTYYEDIQELLVVSDCLITDYSSCMFDFLFTRRPAFIFATDIEKYKNERGFYYPLEVTPFPIAMNNMEIAERIMHFDTEKFISDVNDFLKGKGCIEDGKASDRVAELVDKYTDESKTYVYKCCDIFYQKYK